MAIHPVLNPETWIHPECCEKVKLRHCCCCIPLRAGCIAYSILGIIGSVCVLGLDEGWIGMGIAVSGCIANGCLLVGSWQQIRQPLMTYLILGLTQIIVMFVAGILHFVLDLTCGETNELCRQMDIVAACGLWALACIYVYFWFCALVLYNTLNAARSNHPVEEIRWKK